jgi:hypothetical protein
MRISDLILPGLIVLLTAGLSGCAAIKQNDESIVAVPVIAPRNINLDDAAPGTLPTSFTTAVTGGGGPESWVVREDPTLGQKHILVQESADETSYRFPLCIYEDVIASDLAVEVKYKALAGKVDEAGGIVLRYSPENYYIARANALEDNVNLFKTVRGKRVKIEEVPVKVTSGEWHTLRFEAKGKRLTVWFDGRLMIDRYDRSFLRPGRVGLWTKADSVSAFRDLKIEPPR